MLKGVLIDIREWFLEMCRVTRRQYRLIFTDMGVMLFFFVLPLAYPVLYALIYNPEVTRDMPVAVVDNCRTEKSREFIRHADAAPTMKIVGYASDIAEARRWMDEHRVYGVFLIPEDYSRRLGRGEQGVIDFYADMALLLRYRNFLESLTSLQMATCTQLRNEGMGLIGFSNSTQNVEARSYFLGDTQQGFASFIMPAIVVLILQQSMLLGIGMLYGNSRDRRRRNRGYDPMELDVSPSAMIIGQALCYLSLYIPATYYILHFIPEIFAFPHIGNVWQYMSFIFPMLLATAFLGISLQGLMTERESPFIVVVFTSVVFLFLSGITWPRYAMNDFFLALGDIVPATWGVEGFVRMNSNGADLSQQTTAYHWLWGLSAFFFVTAYFVTRVCRPGSLRRSA